MGASLTWTLSADHAEFAFPAGRVPRSQPLVPMAHPEAGRTADADIPLTELDERMLIAACRANRPGAFDLLVERHQRAIYQLCYRFVSHHEDASDLSQDVFLRA